MLALTLERLAAEDGLALPDGEADALARSLPDLAGLPRGAGRARRSCGAAAGGSRSSRTPTATSSPRRCERIGVPFDLRSSPREIGSYKPAHRHWQAFFERRGADPRRHVHVAASLFHDIAPARELGLRTVWINRLGERRPIPSPTRELPDLARLPDALDELVPA